MSRERIVLGRRADVAETAARLSVSVWANTAQTFDRESLVKNAVERVRRHFGRKNKAMGDRYSRVARAYFHHRKWNEVGIPRRSFSHALKKVKDFLYACKQRAESTSES